MRVKPDDEQALIVDVLVANGVRVERAETQARWLVEGDRRGHHSHGLQRLPVIVGRIRNGLTEPNSDPDLEWRTPSVLVVDGKRGLGPCVALAAVNELVDGVRQSGVSVAAVHNANHLGLLAPYVEEIAAEGLIGIAITTSEALVHPWGGRTAMLGTNPIAIAVPATPEPFVLDMATGAVSMGKIIHHRGEGLPLEPGWAIDEDGRPTADAAAATAISPFGGAKGYGLGLAFELLVAALTGAALGPDVTGTLDTETVCNKGDLLVAFDPSVFRNDAWGDAASTFLAELRRTPPQLGSNGVAVPGDRTRRARAAETIDVPDAVWRAARELLTVNA
jgi:LDH2 family malate/lactate/ureidoglycolate dehydrogenase